MFSLPSLLSLSLLQFSPFLRTVKLRETENLFMTKMQQEANF